ncbi:helix-turn-helix domain-containing protein [Streptomyces sp. CB03911]|uniref:winged helix-turn-helix transcriptional regulator n=1 Tax=Streptomycetaceae TaxID=2062 RepID=UPI00093CE2F4|nr:helix-turn-helix domain-containing protein [Streptomyces sp. CB03911]OKI16431.1 HxlR family transcriptional regulator [Streptomyces sp. CB03911]
MDDSAGSVFLADCPARLAIEIITNKWAVVVLFALSRGPCRHGELVDFVGGISRKVLTQTLRRLQGYGLVERRAYPEAPPRVEYSLTDLGRTLVEPIAALTDWARSHGGAVVSFQEAAEEESASGN